MRWGGAGVPKQNKTGRKVGESKVEMIEIRRRCAADKNRGEERRAEEGEEIRSAAASRADGAERRGGSTISVLLLRVYSGTTAAN